ncbi:Soluble lytic murein transglycosylase [Ensifer psoraleae]|nr:lytic transglycosylase domain-containing protein [Sinorhizobium psoraleae]NRP74550.1 Soluble lytic murein transglycosylase [Sinorhizobium psoraleae]
MHFNPSARFTLPALGLPRGVRLGRLLLISGVLSAPTIDVSVSAQTQPAAGDAYAAHINEAARRFAIPTSWIRAVMRVESAAEVHALSHSGAMGLMQIMPETWTELRNRYRLGNDPFDPHDNILAGAAYLKEMHDRYGAPGFLAAYNAGPARYDEYLASGRALPEETRAYIAAIAPLLGTGGLPVFNTSSAADEPSWRQAPIFFTRTGVAFDAKPIPQPSRTDGAENMASPRDFSAARPRQDGLFVARNDSGGAP